MDLDDAKDFEGNLLWCKNPQCVNFKDLFDTTEKRCRNCGSRMKHWNYLTDEMPHNLGDMDAPPADYVDARIRAYQQRDGSILVPESHRLSAEAKSGASTSKRAALADTDPATFTVDCDIEGCPVAPKGILRIPFALFQSWVWLARKFDTEWIAYLKGSEETTDSGVRKITLLVDGMYFPLQRAHSAHVDAETNGALQEGTIASIHSHVSMNAYFSKEDSDHFNHTVDMVVNRRGELAAAMRQKLDCGRFQRISPGIFFLGDETNIGLEKLLKEKLIVEPTPQGLVIEKEFTQRPSSLPARFGPAVRNSDVQVIAKGQNGLVIVQAGDHDWRKDQSRSSSKADWNRST